MCQVFIYGVSYDRLAQWIKITLHVANDEVDVLNTLLHVRKLLVPVPLLNNLLISDIGTLTLYLCASWHLSIDKLYSFLLMYLIHSIVFNSTLYKPTLETLRVHGVLG